MLQELVLAGFKVKDTRELLSSMAQSWTACSEPELSTLSKGTEMPLYLAAGHTVLCKADRVNVLL